MSARLAVWILLPLALLIAIGGTFLAVDPLRTFRLSVPPVEELTVERAVLDGEGMALLVRAGGSEPIRVAQVQVDGAYWQFTQDPPGPSLAARPPGSTCRSHGFWARRTPSRS